MQKLANDLTEAHPSDKMCLSKNAAYPCLDMSYRIFDCRQAGHLSHKFNPVKNIDESPTF